MKILKICTKRTEAETIIENLKKQGIVTVIKAVPAKDSSQRNELHLLVDEEQYIKAERILSGL